RDLRRGHAARDIRGTRLHDGPPGAARAEPACSLRHGRRRSGSGPQITACGLKGANLARTQMSTKLAVAGPLCGLALLTCAGNPTSIVLPPEGAGSLRLELVQSGFASPV